MVDLKHLLGKSAQLLQAIDRIVLASRRRGGKRRGRPAQQLAPELIRSVGSVSGDPLIHAESGRILVVDDNASNRDVLCRRLERYGWPAVAAPTRAARHSSCSRARRSTSSCSTSSCRR